ncbi:MAG: hypothetical protein IKN43_01655 [Selenomonadaceae bacterium]|nr:hypothetical protein [Selenomonadaceae bacterium]
MYNFGTKAETLEFLYNTIDARVSFNSFIPRDLPPDIAEKLVNYYLERLAANTREPR